MNAAPVILALWAPLFDPIAYVESPDEKQIHAAAAKETELERFENSPAESIRSTKFTESVFRWTADRVEAVQPAFWFEIARFRCPIGVLGIISRLWTHLHYYKAGENGDAIDRCLNDPACPWQHENFLPGQLGFKLRWHLRVESIRTIFDPLEPLYFITPDELPGLPFGEDPTWTDQRYAWGNHARNVRLIVPEGHTVRMFVGLEGNCWNDRDCQPIVP